MALFLRPGYPCAMTADHLLIAAAFNTERVAGRRLAARSGIAEGEALRLVLEKAAGAGGLAALLAARAALRDAAQARRTVREAGKQAALAVKMRRHEGPVSAWSAWFDGSAHPNPGRCGIGGVILGPAGERIEVSQAAGYGNSSEAEYMALIAVLEAALAAGARELTVHGDSQGVIDDAAGALESGAAALRQLRARAHELIAGIGTVRLHWVPRHKNAVADALSQRAVASMAQSSEPAAPPRRRDA